MRPRTRTTASPNPADDPSFRLALQRHVERLAATVTYTKPAAPAPPGYADRQYKDWSALLC
jgi:hypothetical protein